MKISVYTLSGMVSFSRFSPLQRKQHNRIPSRERLEYIFLTQSEFRFYYRSPLVSCKKQPFPAKGN